MVPSHCTKPPASTPEIIEPAIPALENSAVIAPIAPVPRDWKYWMPAVPTTAIALPRASCASSSTVVLPARTVTMKYAANNVKPMRISKNSEVRGMSHTSAKAAMISTTAQALNKSPTSVWGRAGPA